MISYYLWVLAVTFVCGFTQSQSPNCRSCLFSHPDHGWCGNDDSTGRCMNGTFTGPNNTNCSTAWYFQLCPNYYFPSPYPVNFPIGLQSNTSSQSADQLDEDPSLYCFSSSCKPKDIFILSSSNPLSGTYQVDKLVGSVVVDAYILINAFLCIPSNITTFNLSYHFGMGRTYTVSFNRTSTNQCPLTSEEPSELQLPLPLPSHQEWIDGSLWDYRNTHHVVGVELLDEDAIIFISSVFVVVSEIYIDSDLREIFPSIIPFNFGVDNKITVKCNNLMKLEYKCQFVSVNGPVDVDPIVDLSSSGAVIYCTFPSTRLLIGNLILGEPISVLLYLYPVVNSDISFYSTNLLVYSPPILTTLQPSSILTTGQWIEIWGSGFFNTPSLMITLNPSDTTTNITTIDPRTIQVEPPGIIRFLAPPLTTSLAEYMFSVRVFMNGYDSLRPLALTYKQNIPPVNPVLTTDACHECITRPSNDWGWCGIANDAANGECLLGNSSSPFNKKCEKWSWTYCPESKEIPIYPIREIIIADAGIKCPDALCSLNRNSTVLSRSKNVIFPYSLDIPSNTVVQSVEIYFKGAICYQEIMKLEFSLDDDPTNNVPTFVFREIVNNDTCNAGQLSTHSFSRTVNWNAAWDFDFSAKNYSLLVSDHSLGIFQQTISLVLLQLTFYTKIIDPMISGPQIVPSYFEFCSECEVRVMVFAVNLLRFEYVCQLSFANNLTFTTTAKYNNSTTRFCDFYIDKSVEPYQPLPARPNNVTFMFYPLTNYTYLYFAPYNLSVYYKPVYDALSPDKTQCNTTTIVNVNGTGFFSGPFVEVYVNGTPIQQVYVVNDSLIEFSVPLAFSNSTVCIEVSLNAFDKSKCFNFTYVCSSTANSSITIIQFLLSLLTRYWYIAVFLLVLLSVIVFFSILSCKGKNKSNNDTYSPVPHENSESESFPFEIKHSDIKLKEVIGVGSFATVYLGLWENVRVAIKVLRNRSTVNNNKNAESLKRQFLDEAHIMVQLRHPNIVSFLGACVNEPASMFIVTEYMPKGSLNDILHNNKLSLELEHIRMFALDCCKGMSYLHKKNIIHRDLKTHNLLVDSDWTIKVSDFGLSRMLEDTSTAQTLTACGTPSWAAPEVLKDQKYSIKADVFSFGVCLWEMCTREDPYKNFTAAQVVIFVAVEGKRPPIPESTPAGFVHIVNCSWMEDSQARPSFEELISLLKQLNLPKPANSFPVETIN